MKSFFSSILFSLIFLLNANNSSAQTFLDVPPDRDDHVYIEDMVEKGIFDTNHTFRPDDTILRAEMAKIIVIASNGIAHDKIRGKKSFPDVPSQQWFYPYIESAHYYNFLHGYKDGFFRPGQSITRGEAIKIIFLATGLPARSMATKYRDISPDTWYRGFAESAFVYEIYKGKTVGNGKPKYIFDGQTAITRGEMATYLSKALSVSQYYYENN